MDPIAASTAPARIQATRPTERLASLDVLRGFAIFGIFMVNIGFFAMPMMANFDTTLLADAPASDLAAWAIVRGLFEYKFVSLFSLLFGAGMILQMQRAEAKGVPLTAIYMRRTFLLMGIGLIHALLLWYGDILFIYSFVALLAFLLRGLRPKAMLWCAAVAIGLSALLAVAATAIGVISAEMGTPAAAVEPVSSGDEAAPTIEEAIGASKDDDAAAGPPLEPAAGDAGTVETDSGGVGAGAPAAEPDDHWDRFLDALSRFDGSASPASSEAELMAYEEGPMAVTIVYRSLQFAMIIFSTVIAGFGLRVAGMFLIGAALMKLRFFHPDRRRWQQVMCIWGLPLGLAGEGILIATYALAGLEKGWLHTLAEGIHHISSLALCLGYVGAITLVVSSGWLRPVSAALASVGRLALTNYLGQTLIATSLMYWWGLGWFNEVSRLHQLGLVCLIYLGQVIASVLWLRVFSIGPFEWLWRSLTYLRPQPWRS